MTPNKYYLGARSRISPDKLLDLESTAEWLAMPKIDGCWVAVQCGEYPKYLTRYGTHFDWALTGGLPVLAPEGCVLIGELIAKTAWSARRYEKTGYRELFLWDVARWKKNDLYPLEYIHRRKLLNDLAETWSDDIREQIHIVPAFDVGFTNLYKREVKSREGVMLWRKDLKDTPNRDRKTTEILKCKK